MLDRDILVDFSESLELAHDNVRARCSLDDATRLSDQRADGDARLTASRSRSPRPWKPRERSRSRKWWRSRKNLRYAGGAEV